MKICVLGAGVVGVSTAFALSRVGHEVIVLERADRVASGASQANGAQLSWSFTDPLASPDTLKKLPKFLFGLDPAMRIRPSLNPPFLGWGSAFLKNCSSKSFVIGREARDQLAKESEIAIQSFERDLPSGALKRTGRGKIVLAQTKSQATEMRQSSSYCSAHECIEHEPALKSWRGKNLGGLFSPKDEALDTVKFCSSLMNAAQNSFDVEFRFNENVQSVALADNRVQSVITDSGTVNCDAVIVCLGNHVNTFIKPLGLSIPMCSVRGYSVTLPATNIAPKVSLTDLKNKIVFANLGQKIRIAGFADINTSSDVMDKRVKLLIDLAKQNWPDIANYQADPAAWTGSRPMTPSGIPVIGETEIAGLYLNAGHGSLGYTFAAGSAARITNEIGGVQ